jgi:hypothetical protein
MSDVGVYLVAALSVVVLLAIVEGIAHVGQHQSFLGTVVLGLDGRTSTSKSFIFMWTLVVGWALVALLIAGELIHRHACVPTTIVSDVTSAARACKAHRDQLGLLEVGWLHFLHAGLAGAYLILLGVPAAAGVAAKGITQSQVSGSGFKKPKPKAAHPDPVGRIAEVFSADDGTTDIGDFQYLIFNLIAAVYFVAQFVNPDGTGLPTMPDTLLGLTSVSAGLYVGKKAVSRSQPLVTGVFPTPLHDGQQFTVIGSNLAPDPSSPSKVTPQITIDGMSATNVTCDDAGNLTALAPVTVSAGGTSLARQLQVLNPYGGVSPNFQVPCL